MFLPVRLLDVQDLSPASPIAQFRCNELYCGIDDANKIARLECY